MRNEELLQAQKNQTMDQGGRFTEVLCLLQEKDFSCDELLFLIQQLNQLYSIKANTVVESLPLDLWTKIFRAMKFEKVNPKKWLHFRTVRILHFLSHFFQVNKAFNQAILGFNKLNLRHFYPNKIVELFQLGSCSIDDTSNADLALFTNLKKLCFSKGPQHFINNTNWELLASLTQLKTLKLFKGLALPNSCLDCLTNLTQLTIQTESITDIRALTHLTSLRLRSPFVIQYSTLQSLTQITKLVSDDPKIFLGGKGTCIFPNGEIYTGEWMNCLFEGQGKLNFSDGDTYEGQFLKGERDGYGILMKPTMASGKGEAAMEKGQ